MKPRNERVVEAVQAAERKMSVIKIAEACDVSRQTVYNWRRGDCTNLTGESLVELAEISGLSARWIINGKGPKIPTVTLSQEAIDMADKIMALVPEKRALLEMIFNNHGLETKQVIGSTEKTR